MSQDTCAVGADKQKAPSVMRFERVQTILEADPALRPRLGPKNQEVLKRNGDKHFFSIGVVAVTHHLHKKGIDASNANPPLVLSIAAEVLNILKDKPAVFKKPTPVKIPAAPKPKAAPKAVSKPKPKSKPAVVPVKEPEAVAALPAIAPVVEPVAPAPAAPPAPVAVSQVEAEPPVRKIEPPAAAPNPQQVPVYYVYSSSFTMLASVAQLLDLADNQPGAEHRKEKLGNLMDELYLLKDVGVPLPLEMLPPSLKNAKAVGAKS